VQASGTHQQGRKVIEVVVRAQRHIVRHQIALAAVEALGAKVSRLAHAVHVAIVGCNCWFQLLKTKKRAGRWMARTGWRGG